MSIVVTMFLLENKKWLKSDLGYKFYNVWSQFSMTKKLFNAEHFWTLVIILRNSVFFLAHTRYRYNVKIYNLPAEPKYLQNSLRILHILTSVQQYALKGLLSVVNCLSLKYNLLSIKKIKTIWIYLQHNVIIHCL